MVGLALILGLAGCSRPVAMDEQVLTGRAAQICSGLMADLPSTVLDQKRREVEPGLTNAAWGDPTITLRCGVAKPSTLLDSSSCLEVNGVGWFGEQGTGGAVFTTIGRPVYVQVGVPSAYGQPPGALVDVADAISKHDPVTSPCQ